MKKILLLVVMAGIFSISNAQNIAPEPVIKYIACFEKAVLTHNYDSVMEYMDNEYIKVQYKKMLKKNVEQFIDEFFGGNVNPDNTGSYINTHLSEISAISMQSLEVLGNEEYRVSFKITRHSGLVHYNVVMLRKYKKQLGFFGSMG